MPNKNFTNFTENISPGLNDFLVGYLDGGAVNSELKIKYSSLGTSTNTANRLVLRDGSGNFNTNYLSLNRLYAIDSNNPIILANSTSINTATKIEALTVNGPIYIEAGTSNYQTAAVSLSNRTNTYITLGNGGSSNDWAYIRQVGEVNAFTLAIDLHDDANSGSGQGFAIRNIASSAGEPDPYPVTNFYVSPLGNVEVANNLTINTNNTNQAALFISDQGGIHDFRNGFMNVCFTGGVRFWSGKLSPTPIYNTLSIFNDGTLLANGGVVTSRIDASNLVGMVAYFAHTNTGPAGWLECNGASLPTGAGFEYVSTLRTFLINGGSVYGTSNGDPRLPDLRGRFIRSSNESAVRDFQEMNITTTLNSNVAILNNLTWLTDVSTPATNALNDYWYNQVIIGSAIYWYPTPNIGGLDGATITAIDVPNRRVTFSRNATIAATGTVLANRSIGTYQKSSIPHHTHGYNYSILGNTGISWSSPSYTDANYLKGIASASNQRSALRSFDVGSLSFSGTAFISVGANGDSYESRPPNINFKAYIKL